MQAPLVSAMAMTRLMDSGIDNYQALRLHLDPPPGLRDEHRDGPYTYTAPDGEQCLVERGQCSSHTPPHIATTFHTDHGYTRVLVTEHNARWIIVCSYEDPCWLITEGIALPEFLTTP